MFAPVLVVPNVLPPQLCQQLIELWSAGGNEPSGFMVATPEGGTVGVHDAARKIRRDHFIKAGQMEDAVKQSLVQRLLPRVREAFQFPATRREDFRIACYDASTGGYFRAHRDNTTPATAHRKFAVSLLLNEDYEGGFLQFPDFGGERVRYRPPAGGAAVFSSSLLHEATDVTAGRRFVLITFLYGEAEAKQREANALAAGHAYRA